MPLIPIAPTRLDFYLPAMAARLLRLLTLIALVLMPLGMAAAPATAEHHSTANMPMQHCPDEGSKSPELGTAFAECTMACAATLPAQPLRSDERVATIVAAAVPSLPVPLRGLVPETATPPPRSF
jgi:hypothetical protein